VPARTLTDLLDELVPGHQTIDYLHLDVEGAHARAIRAEDTAWAARVQTIKVAGHVPGMSAGVDPVTNQVVVRLDPTVDAAERAHVEAALTGAGDAARIETTKAPFTTMISGGEQIFSAVGRCSLGFNARKGNEKFFLTAGHCVKTGPMWGTMANGGFEVLGDRVDFSYPGNDYGIVKYAPGAPTPYGDVYLRPGYRNDIQSARDAIVGEDVQRSGFKTGLRSGRVIALNQSVWHAAGEVTGLTLTNACAEPGDSGGPLFSGTAALGTLTGGSSDCTTPWYALTYYQPVREVLNRYGVEVY